LRRRCRFFAFSRFENGIGICKIEYRQRKNGFACKAVFYVKIKEFFDKKFVGRVLTKSGKEGIIVTIGIMVFFRENTRKISIKNS
jgi:hypothetical protein